MASELQRIVDALGSRLQRAIAIDDPRMRLQVYSPHYGPVDETRLGSILHREAPAHAAAWVLKQGIADVPDVVRLPINQDLELLPRVCAPIRYQGVLLGYLWLIDAEESLSDEELEEVISAANAAGLVMYREQLLNELERGRERELLRDLLSDDPSVRGHAAEQLVEADLFVTAPAATVLVVEATSDRAAADEHVRTVIDQALSHGRRLVSSRHALQLARPDHGVLLAAGPSLSGGVVRLGERMRERLLKGLDERDAWRVHVGIGEKCKHLADAAHSYRQARQAARIARIVPVFGPVVSWRHLGIYRILAQLPANELSAEGIHPGLQKLLSGDAGEVLVRTLECYLDHAGDAKSTAAELVVHRTSLYYRLKRIEEITGVDLHSGEDRLALHLGLKIARLAGMHPLQARP